MIEENPGKGVRKAITDVKLERHLPLAKAEIDALGAAMRKAIEESPVALVAIRFMLLTGFRRMEILALERAWVDATLSCVRFPTTDSGAQLRVIGGAAAKLLALQTVALENHYVFPREIGEGHFFGLMRVLRRLCFTAKLHDVTPHVLRHTFASVDGDLGFSELTIAGLLGQAGRSVTLRYIHLDSALVMVADKIVEELPCP